MPSDWNHNTHYHGLILKAAPRPCASALDIGCGAGVLASKLASLCSEVIGIDIDLTHISPAKALNVKFVAGDVLTYPLPLASFDLLTAVAVLHHMPLQEALDRMKALLRPGGVLVILGLFQPTGAKDWCHFGIAWLGSYALRLTRLYEPGTAATRRPRHSLAEICAAAAVNLPGARIQRRLLFRYTLEWTKPLEVATSAEPTR